MAIPDVAEEHFTFESRLASFQTAQQLPKRRASNANSKAPKSMKWPHKFLSPQELAKAGFFYYPLQANPDNVACFLCHKSLDGWEEGDDPLSEHLKHSPDCGWAIVASIEKRDEDLSQEYPSSARMLEARKATFADRWPHEGKKGWKCKVKQLVDAGWKYTPTPEYDDMATCAYCSLALDGWEPGDKPIDEHAKRSPDCPFFSLIQNHKQSPAVKRTKSKRDRTSKASRLSTQSSFTVPMEDASLADLPAEEGDSILTTATTATATGKKMGKGKKPAAAKGRKTRAKKTEPIGVETAPEPEDDDFEVKVDEEPKPTRGRKRKSDQTIESSILGTEAEAPQPKRRATRTRGSMAVDDSMIDEESVPTRTASQPKGRKGRASTKSTREASAASAASLRAPIPNDDEIDQALEADLERPLTDDEAVPASAPAPKKGTRSSKVTKSDHAMFSAEPMEVDEAAIDAELEAMEVESNPPPKAKGAKGKQPRKPSAKQQAAAAKKAAEAEAAAEAERLAQEEAEASRQIEAEFEKSISMQHSSPIIQPKKQRASRQPAKRATGRATRGSVMPVNESNISMADEIPDILDEQKDDSGNETDASMASQSTVVRGGASRRGSTMKKGRGGKKAASRNIEEIVRKPQNPVTEDEEAAPSRKGKSIVAAEEIEEPVAILEDEGQVVEEPAPKPAKTKAAKPRGRPAKAAPAPAPAPASVVLETSPEMDETIEEPAPILPKVKASKGKAVVQAPRSPTPPPKEATPSQSPQSSDAENQPPSSKPSAAPKKVATPHSTTTRVPLASTPVLSPSKRNIIAGLQTAHPWKAVDLDAIFLNSPSSNENSVRGLKSALGDAMEKAKNGDLTSPEKKMSVEEWIHYNAGLAEEKLRGECERMVGIFEREGGKAMRALEGVECVE